MDTAIQAVWQARAMGRSAEAAEALAQVRQQLQRTPADSARFSTWARQVAELYQQVGWNARARGTLQGALDRTAPLGDSHPTRSELWHSLGDFWWQDGNLLKAAACLEQAAAGQAAAAPGATAPRFGAQAVRVFGQGAYAIRMSGPNRGVAYGSGMFLYARLADLYQQLGRPDAVAAVALKIRELGADDQGALAQFFAQHGQVDEAAAVYKKMAEQSGDAQARGNAWHMLANLHASQEHYADAIGAMQKAIAAVEAADSPEIRGQAIWMRQNLARYLQQANLTDQADQIYAQLLTETRGKPEENQVLGNYSQHLAQTQRAAEGENLLKQYLAGPDLEPPMQMNTLYQLSNVARMSGNEKRAQEYQQAAEALQQRSFASNEGQVRIAEEVRKAEKALSQQRMDEAYGLAVQAIDRAAQAEDGQQVDWLVPQVANRLVAEHETAKADLLFRRLFAQAQERRPQNLQPLIAAAQNYARYLITQPGREDETAAAIDEYRNVLVEANGTDSGSMALPLRLRIEWERTRGQWQKAAASAQEMLELQETLSGNTSAPYLDDLQNLARVYEAAGNAERGAVLLQKAVAIADRNDSPDSAWQRSATRMEAAMALARLARFDEAEALAQEGVALAGKARVPRPQPDQELEQIRQMRRAAEAKQQR
jgi:hypothetical protein